MKYHLGYVLIIISIFFSFSTYEVKADLSVKIEKQITPDSGSLKIKKLQNLFTELGLYSGEIDGNYLSIKKTLIDYQIKSGVIDNEEGSGAGYFGQKTFNALKNDFENFEELALKNLKIDPPKVGKTKFTVSAYYSPLPGQDDYITGTYEGDIKLNGKGKHTASGKNIFAGVLAGPTNYEFGTKVYIEGLGVGVIEDRGSAIVNAGERGYDYDRIDVWMGYGDEGLQKAIKWGKKTVDGEVFSNEEQKQITIKVNENDKVVVLSDKDKEELEKIKQKIVTYVEKKYKGSEDKKQKYKDSIKTALDKYIALAKDEGKREKLKYLKGIL